MEHTAACLELAAKVEAKRREYESSWPNHCRECRGWGMHAEKYDPSPSGVSLSPGTMTDVWPCARCIDAAANGGPCDHCPRCGIALSEEAAEVVAEGQGGCPGCGWKVKDRGMPDEPECVCC